MNNILQLKGHFEHKRNPRGFGPKNLPGNGSVSSEHINELISELEEILSFWQKNTLIGGALISVHYNTIIAKSNRVQGLFIKGSKMSSNDSIRGSKFEIKDENINHVFTHFVSLDLLRESIRRLEICSSVIEEDFDGEITYQDIEFLNKTKNYSNEELSYTNFVTVLIDAYHVREFKIDQDVDDIKETTIITIYKTKEKTIDLLKKLGDVDILENPVYVTLFPCDRCMKVLISKGVKKIYYLEDHLERNWSKRSHELASKYGIETICLLKNTYVEEEKCEDYSKYKYVYPPNAREQKQLDIMVEQERNGIDPFDPEIIDQDILFSTNNWYVSRNRFPYEGVEHQFLIIAYNEVYRVEDISPEMWAELNYIWNKLIIDYNLDGGALCFRFGVPALSGASVKRLHAHIVVPKENNKTKFTIGGKKVLKKGLVIKPPKGN